MKFDLRNVSTYWLNLKEHESNKNHMEKMLGSLGFKNHRRSPGIRVSGFEGVNYHQSINHYMGVGLAQLNAMRQIKDSGILPSMILEDDVDVTSDYSPLLEIPDATDALYLGISNAGSANGYNMKNGYARIFNVLSAHAIVYVSQRFLDEVIRITKIALFDKQMPFDLPLAQLQTTFNVITPMKPYFYQSDLKESQNKWQALTSQPLKIYG